MANWKNIGLAFGKTLLATQGISLGKDSGRSPRRRRRRGRGPDYPAVATGFREVLQDELSDGELEEVDSAIVLLAQLIIEERREEEDEDEEDEEEPDPPPRRKKAVKKKAKK